MFINFWYVAGMSGDFGENPVRRRMLGQDFVLFRDAEGVARVLSNTCTHRGGSLAGGRLRDGCIQCPYHGWLFGGDGRCHRIPSLGPDARIPPRARVDAYPTRERYGLVFAFLGDLPEEDRPPIMTIEEFGADGQQLREGTRATWQHFNWDFDYKRSMENGIDPAHNEFVHPTHGFSGERDDYQVNEIRLREDEWGCGFFNSRIAPALAEKKMREASGRDKPAIVTGGTGHVGVSSIWTWIHPTPDMHIHQYLFETPIDECRTSLYLVNVRNFLIDPEDDQRMTGRNEVVALQDRDVLYDIHPRVTPETRTKEIFLPADSPIARYRDKLKQWERRGWRIDTETVNRNHRKVAYAIPSPGRRTTKGWVLDPVPLLPASENSSETITPAAAG